MRLVAFPLAKNSLVGVAHPLEYRPYLRGQLLHLLAISGSLVGKYVETLSDFSVLVGSDQGWDVEEYVVGVA